MQNQQRHECIQVWQGDGMLIELGWVEWRENAIEV